MKRIVYVLRSYPRASQTFVLNEILTAERLGAPVEIMALSHADDSVRQPVADEIAAPVVYLEDELVTVLQVVTTLVRGVLRWRWRFISTLASVTRSVGVDRGYTSEGRFRCFLHATALAMRLSTPTTVDLARSVHLHAHFAHDPAYVALLVARLTGVSYSFTGHARDLYQVESDLLAERVACAEFVATVTNHNRELMLRAAPGVETPIHVIPQGAETTRFTPRTGDLRLGPPVLSAVGRLVPKKGFDVLVAACDLLVGQGYRFRCVIVGDGTERAQLEDSIRDRGLAHIVSVNGPRPQAELVDVYRSSDIFVLPAVVTADGDSDALPTVLLEAMSCSLPSVTTNVGGITELVTDEHNGLLVVSADASALAGALARLLDDSELRSRLGEAARVTVLENFDHYTGVTRLVELFAAVGSQRPSQREQKV